MKTALVLTLSTVIMFICPMGIATAPEPSAATIDTPKAQKTVDAQAMADLAAGNRSNMPGAAHYDKACASCHEGAVQKAPHREMLYLQTPESVYSAITEGIMVAQASGLTDQERIEVAEWIGGQPMGTAKLAEIPQCDASAGFSFADKPSHSSWGAAANQRNWSSSESGIAPDSVKHLKPLWAVKLPNANKLRSQPTFAGGLLYVGSHGGGVYALDQKTGCQVWHFKTVAEVRSGISVDVWNNGETDSQPQIYFGDTIGNVYAVSAETGELIWRDRADSHPSATITGAPALNGNILYVPVSSLEVALAVNPAYECCTGRGSVVAYDTRSGDRLWQTFTIPDAPTLQSVNAAGTNMYGPSGSMVWNSPTIDHTRNQLFIGTGENMSSPADHSSDAIFAIDLTTGKVNWIYQALANDAWNAACGTKTPQSCPKEDGPDFDFGAGTLLVKTDSGRQLVVAGQKSGIVHALEPATGKLVWKNRVGRGGIQGGVHFGMAAGNGKIYVPISDGPDGQEYDTPDRPGLHALNADTGEILWYSPAPNVCAGRDFCDPGVSQAISVISGKVFAGAMDGVMRAHNADTGKVIYQIDTTKPFTSISGEMATGGSFGGGSGAVAKNGLVVISSGYGIYAHMPGNMLMMLSVE